MLKIMASLKIERVFIVSVDKNIKTTFQFPETFYNGLELNDLLEKNIDEKYYINSTNKTKIIPLKLKYNEGLSIVGYLRGLCMPGQKILCKHGIFSTCRAAGELDKICDPKICDTNSCDKNITIRKPTPLEFFRLMGFDDKDYYILKENNIPDTQLYKMAGNSIVVNKLEGIFKRLFNK